MDRPLRVIQITDTHLVADSSAVSWGHDNQAKLDAVLSRAQSRHFPADALLATGDLVHDESEAGYRRLARQLASLGAPVYALPGNHDSPERLARIFHRAGLAAGGHHVLGPWTMSLLDSHIPGSNAGRVDPEALTELDRHLAGQGDRPALIWLHHNPVPVGSRWLDTMQLENAEALFEVVDKHPQVRAVLWGHVHQHFDDRRGHVRLLATPATTRQFLPGSDEFALDSVPPGYRWLDLFPDGTIETGIERVPVPDPIADSGA